jgi:hypothetical protein
VWKIDLLQTKHTDGGGMKLLFLVCCMQGGARIVEVACDGEERWSIEVLARFEKLDLCYACTAFVDDHSDGKEKQEGKAVSAFVVVATSFYEKKVCTWRLAWE